MSSTVISRSPDLRRLHDEGYDTEVRDGFLLLKEVPYLTSDGKVRRGTLVSKLDLAGDVTTKPTTHVAYFTGDHPCGLDGSRIEAIAHASGEQALLRGLVVHHSFSNKPADGYTDYYHKMTTYVGIIEHEAQAVDPAATARVGKVVELSEEESVFMYMDTASSRAAINPVSEKLRGSKVAILGVGGTGSYILDLLTKTPVTEIHLYDGDKFFQHNAFRSPGVATATELREQPLKVDYFKSKYDAVHRGIIAHEAVDETSVAGLTAMDFVFVSMDGGAMKELVVATLEAARIPFVVVGMGLQLVDDSILGQVCVTTSMAGARMHDRERVSFADGGGDYDTNIQVADLNALNAALAVIKWKKLLGFYLDLDREYHCTYTLSGNMLTNDDKS
jgi:ThiF family